MMISSKFEWGQEVYLKTDDEQKKFIISKILVQNPLCVQYLLSNGRYAEWHSECEISDTVDLAVKIKNM